ncbi:MAG: NAD-dependent succinate-semialdehyde dehydrogenase, partial [Trueperaceae bacterium]|nr:NAD-dependent succinate-semialdehyde dehydrogenase [Trueperaceae bacterium]
LVEPASGAPFGSAADTDADIARAAIDVAWTAFESWRAVSPFERAAVLRRWYDGLVAHGDELGELMAHEMGKPLKEARGEALYAAGFVEWYAEEAKRAYGEWVPTHVTHKRIVAMRQPVGPAYAVTPWNFPAAMITRKAAPALAAGCPMIVKPAEQTPFTALRLAELWLEAGGPEGTLQVLPTSDPVPVTEVMMADPRIRKVTFTGSTEVGRILYRQSAQTIKKLSLELGGHAPYLVFDDADLDAAVREVLACKFRNAGQTCVCTNRIYVQDGIHDAFVAAFATAVRGLKLGDPLADGTDVGPLVDAQGMAKVEAHVADAVARGATVVVGGARREGLYFEPTLITGVAPGMQLMEEETFGPVAPVLRFATEAEAIERANATPFGLASYVYTRDLARAIRVAEALEYGIVGVNDGVPSVPYAPFGGVKQSGIGREGGPWGLEEYLETKFVSLGIG